MTPTNKYSSKKKEKKPRATQHLKYYIDSFCISTKNNSRCWPLCAVFIRCMPGCFIDIAFTFARLYFRFKSHCISHYLCYQHAYKYILCVNILFGPCACMRVCICVCMLYGNRVKFRIFIVNLLFFFFFFWASEKLVEFV